MQCDWGIDGRVETNFRIQHCPDLFHSFRGHHAVEFERNGLPTLGMRPPKP